MTSDGALSTLLAMLSERHLDALGNWGLQDPSAGGGPKGVFHTTYAVVSEGRRVWVCTAADVYPDHLPLLTRLTPSTCMSSLPH